jgi:cobalt/nickel transport system permease protein
LLALGAAFSFVIMMFNVPIPGGTTGHATGSVLIAILLGPWAACVAVSLALVVQAVLFGDGGITAIGANCLNMAVIAPCVGWWVYGALGGGAPGATGRRPWAAAVAGYAGLNAAAFTTALMFGLQPLIAHDAAGRALYSPFGPELAVPAMMLEHLLLFGWVEALVTALVVAYVQRSEPALLLGQAGPGTIARRLALGLAVLIVLSPLGLFLPEKFGSGDAWGEWSLEDLAAQIGYTPRNMERLTSLWHAPMPDYSLPGQENAGLSTLSFSYILSAVVGAGLLVALTWGVRALIQRRSSSEPST